MSSNLIAQLWQAFASGDEWRMNSTLAVMNADDLQNALVQARNLEGRISVHLEEAQDDDDDDEAVVDG